jgi:mannose-1-phosphate guanylyltransferase
VNRAFVLGAGLGTRLQPLTSRLPKPLVPLFHRPLAAWAMDACKRLGIEHFAVNSHHLPAAWAAFGNDAPPGDPQPAENGVVPFRRMHDGCDVTLFHEPILLETGGGLRNIADWIGNDPLLVHNGDIFSSMPLARLADAHRKSGLPVTLALRSQGTARHIAIDSSGTRVTDIRAMLGRAEGTHLFTGVYCIEPAFLDLLPCGEKVSVIPAFLELAKQGRLGAVVINEGEWLDLGDRQSYLLAHRSLDLGPRIHPDAIVAGNADVGRSVIGPGATIAEQAVLEDCVVWPGATVAGGAQLYRCIVYSETPASGVHHDADL